MDEIIIDGNNLEYALRSHGTGPHVTRHQMIRLVEDFITRTGASVLVVFDGAAPPRSIARHLRSKTVRMRFSAPRIADEVIIDLIHEAKRPNRLRIVSGDRYIQNEAVSRGARVTTSIEFVEELHPPQPPPASGGQQPHHGDRADTRIRGAGPRSPEETDPNAPPPPEKPSHVTRQERDQWMEAFGFEDLPDERPSSQGDSDDDEIDMSWADGAEPR
ncbi:MAG: NYN domain-containing protein [Vicinamibacterales bacterium]